MSRPQIALLTEMIDFDESYMDLVWRASDQQARELDAHLIACVGRRIDRLEPEAQAHNLIYSLALEHDFDAFMISQTVYQRSPPEQRDRFAQLFADKAAASVSIPLGEVPIIAFDNDPPMRELMRHLIRTHGYQRILVVTGPTVFEEAQTRLNIWHEELAMAGLDHGAHMIIPGHFHPSYVPDLGETAYRRIKETRAQAIVVCTDLVAAFLQRELQARGLRIPEDIALTGYDDISLARFLNPPLTTVRQPVVEQYKAAMRAAWALKKGGAPSPKEMVGHLMIRGSCGCAPELWSEDISDFANSAESIALDALRDFQNGCEVPIEVLRNSLALSHEKARFLRTRVSDLNLFARRIDELSSIEGLGSLLDEWLPRLGIDTYLVSISCDEKGAFLPSALNEDSDQILPPAARLSRVLVCKPALSLETGSIFAASEIVVPGWMDLLPRSTLVALPLVLNNTWYGLAVLVISGEGNLMCRTVQELTASFFDREYRMREMVRKNLEARIRAQMEAEKVQSTGTLIAGVAHDLSSPLGVSRTSCDFLTENFRHLRAGLESNQITRGDMMKFLDDGDSALAILTSSTKRVIDQVASFKRISVEVPRGDLRRFFVVGFIRDILKNLQPLWRHRALSVDLNGPEDLEVNTYAAPFIDILTNLIQNSLVHAWPADKNGRISITVETGPKPGHCRIVFADDGVGIPPELANRIFEPFFTTREGQGGTGLGLHIVQQRVQGLLAGTVHCESVPGAGTRFIIDFPCVLSV